MEITLSEVRRHECSGYVSHSVTVTVGKKSALVSLPQSGRVNVVCLNASHRAGRGPGRDFPSFAEARDGYKSDAMKTALDEAETVLLAAGGGPRYNRPNRTEIQGDHLTLWGALDAMPHPELIARIRAGIPCEDYDRDGFEVRCEMLNEVKRRTGAQADTLIQEGA